MPLTHCYYAAPPPLSLPPLPPLSALPPLPPLRPPRPPRPQSVIEAIRTLVHRPIPGGRRAQLGILTYSNSVQFYPYRAHSEQPCMTVMGDLHSPFVPLPTSGWLVPVATEHGREHVRLLLRLLLLCGCCCCPCLLLRLLLLLPLRLLPLQLPPYDIRFPLIL